ncbi:MAG: MerR family transcriptional regulator [Elusimicrobia bacterium]|nr:MerR family transcriptional regulator [Elusimicrobiota bacterium]
MTEIGCLASVAARQIGVCSRTLALWAEQGKIKSFRTVGGWRLYPESEVVRLRAAMQKAK